MAAALKSRAERYEQGRELRRASRAKLMRNCMGLRDRDPVAILAEADAERVPELCLSATSE